MSFQNRTLGTAKASKADNLFAGMSQLRADEKKKEKPKQVNAAMQAYLQRYTGDGDGVDGSGNAEYAEPKRKKKKKAANVAAAIKIVDHDDLGLAPRGDSPRHRSPVSFSDGDGGGGDDDDDEGGSLQHGVAWGCMDTSHGTPVIRQSVVH